MVDIKYFVAAISAIIIVLIGGYMYIEKNGFPIKLPNQTEQNSKSEQESNIQQGSGNPVENSENTVITEPEPIVEPETENPDLSTKQGLSLALKQSADNKDYSKFAELLKKVYENKWEGDDLFGKTESALYVSTTEQYFDKGDIEKALEIASIVYEQVPQGWRFRYLKIRSLEFQGRTAYNQGDLKTAEEKAITILQMMYRREGADLLADVYIKKIEINIQNNDKQSAINNLNLVWDYEMSDNRRARLIELKEQIFGI
jgi:hypothetical protein